VFGVNFGTHSATEFTTFSRDRASILCYALLGAKDERFDALDIFQRGKQEPRLPCCFNSLTYQTEIHKRIPKPGKVALLYLSACLSLNVSTR
jgi:hypothetical protein